MVVMLCVAALFTVLPICAAESNIVPEEGYRPSPEMAFVSEVADGEIQFGVQSAMRHLAKQLVSKAARTATQEAQVQGLSHNQLQEFVQRAVMRVHNQISPELVETAAKAQAIKLAKKHAKKAAATAAAQGLSTVEQAHAAKSAARAVALSFASVARESGVRLARDEVALQSNMAIQLGSSQVSDLTETSEAPKQSSDVANKIEATASKGISDGVANAKKVAEAEAKKQGLNSVDTKKLVDEAPQAVKDAADSLKNTESSNLGTTGKAQQNAAADADAYANGDNGSQISLDKAASDAKEKAKQDLIAKYKLLAEAEKKKARKALEVAARTERNAATYVNDVASNSLARGLDSSLSTKNLKLAAAKATDASNQVEMAVKQAVSRALREKERLNTANEKVNKAGDDARKEAEIQNEEMRKESYDTKKARQRSEEGTTKELARKKEQANEAAHKAIARVVSTTGKKASRKAARKNAALIQEAFVSDSCHRKVQHRIRQIAKTAREDVSKRGLSVTAQDSAASKAMQAAKDNLIGETVTNTVQRQAHLSASSAKRQAAARGLSNAEGLDAARKAWKAAAPKIRSLCKPAAQASADTAMKNPGAAPEEINQDAFITRAVQTMKAAVTKACTEATQPVVIDGAKLAAKHDADYNFQVMKGREEAWKVCNATVTLYNRNAEVMSKAMVMRSFDDDSDARSANALFEQEIRQDSEIKVKGAEKSAETNTGEKMNKQCTKKTNSATALAKDAAARAAVTDASNGYAGEKAKAAYDKTYSEALTDGLSIDRAKKLATSAKAEAFRTTQATAKDATSGMAPRSPSSLMDLQQLRAEWTTYKRTAQQKRAHEARIKKDVATAGDSTAALQALEAARNAVKDVRKVGKEVQDMEMVVTAQEISVPMDVLISSSSLLGMTQEEKADKQTALVHAISRAVQSLHQVGGRLPSEVAAFKLHTELQVAKARIAELEAASKK